MNLSRATCIRALDARDPRFDGVFYVGVTSTRIYCRPVCPAPPPRRDRCQFFANAAAAERRGFRPCLRCRPELAPGNASIDATERVARAASQRISEGALNGRSVDELAAEFNISARQLRRVIEQETGVSPVELAQTQRLLLAKRLLTDTRLSMTQVAFASGFQSLRRFDALFQDRYRLSPSALRKKSSSSEAETSDTVTLTLGFRPPLDWAALLGFFSMRATPGVEYVDGDVYARTVSIDGVKGWVRVFPAEATRKSPRSSTNSNEKKTKLSERRALKVEIPASLTPVLMPLLARLRQLFDLDADPVVIGSQLASCGFEKHVLARPGLRVPGAMDGFDLALRAVLGQQVSVKGATTIAGRFAAKFGEPIETPDERLRTSSPVASRVAAASIEELRALGVTTARAETIQALSSAVASGALRVEPSADIGATIAGLKALPGIGDWTAQYVAMRALRWPDGFPASDLWLRRAAGDLTTAKLEKASQAWRPWRAYAAMHLWHSSASAED